MEPRTRKFVETSGAPRRFADVRIENLEPGENAEIFALVRELGRAFAEDFEGRPVSTEFAVLLGTFGTGKTTLATWLLRRSWEYWAPKSTSSLDFPRFFRISDLAELRFRKHFDVDDDEDRREESRRALECAPVVVIDDVHRVAGYRGEEVFLESVVEKRYDNELSTILTANEMPAEDSRFADFLKYFRIFPLVGESHRGR